MSKRVVKSFLFSSLFLFLLGWSSMGIGQGIINFNTYNDTPEKGRFFLIFPPYDREVRGQLLGGTSADSLAPIGGPARLTLIDAVSGSFSGGFVEVENVSPGAVYFVAVAAWEPWEGESIEEAWNGGFTFALSGIQAVSLGGMLSDGSILPVPSVNDFQNVCFPGLCPEPSALSMALLGGAVFWGYKRVKSSGSRF